MWRSGKNKIGVSVGTIERSTVLKGVDVALGDTETSDMA
jgi:hypothetical protein